jgi:MSHA pilin protein MshD
MRREQGFTLIEMVVFIVVLGVGITGALAAIVQATRGAADPLIHLRAAEVGRSYLAEIGAVPYGEPCSSSQRSDYAELECYDGLDEQPPRDAMGRDLDGYDGYRVTVEVAGAADWEGANGRWVTVTVHPPGSSAIRFDLFRGDTE